MVNPILLWVGSGQCRSSANGQKLPVLDRTLSSIFALVPVWSTWPIANQETLVRQI